MAWDIRAPAYKPHASQFAYGLHGSCTLLGLAACDVISKGMGAWVGDPHTVAPDPASIANVQMVMWRIYQDARGQGLCWPNGAATQQQMIAEAKRLSLPIKDVLWYTDTQPYDAWVGFLHRYVAWASPRPFPLLVQVANGQALYDAETGKHDEAGLACHAFCIYGTQTDPNSPAAGGYIVCDGDNPVIDSKPVLYSLATLAQARPISMIAFDYVTAMPQHR